MKQRLPNLEIGSILHLDPGEGNPAHAIQVSLIGYAPRKSLIVTPLNGLKTRLAEGTSCIAHGTEGSFSTRVLHYCSEPFPYYHLQYPEKTQGTLLRRSQRLDTDTPAVVLSIHDGSHLLSVKMVDISMLGACLVANEPLGKIGDRFSIDLQVSECHGKVTFPFIIRYISQSADENDKLIYQHGVEFSDLDEHTISFISRFIRDTVAEQRTTRPNLSIVK